MDERKEPSTRDLVERARSGDREAAALLVSRYQSRLGLLIHLRLGKRLRARSEPDDVSQETWAQAFHSLDSLECRDEGAFFRWLGAIAENVIRNFARKKIPGPLPGAESDNGGARFDPAHILAGSSASPSGLVRQEERFARLEAALDRLSDDHREVIMLARIRMLSMREIGECMARSREASSMLLFRALRQLKKEFGSTDSFGLPPWTLDWSARDAGEEDVTRSE